MKKRGTILKRLCALSLVAILALTSVDVTQVYANTLEESDNVETAVSDSVEAGMSDQADAEVVEATEDVSVNDMQEDDLTDLTDDVDEQEDINPEGSPDYSATGTIEIIHNGTKEQVSGYHIFDAIHNLEDSSIVNLKSNLKLSGENGYLIFQAKDITLNLGEYNISRDEAKEASDASRANHVIDVNGPDACLTIKGSGKIIEKGGLYSVYVTNGASCTLKSGTLVCDGAGNSHKIYGLYGKDAKEIRVEGGKIEAKNNLKDLRGVFVNNCKAYTQTGGTIEVTKTEWTEFTESAGVNFVGTEKVTISGGNITVNAKVLGAAYALAGAAEELIVSGSPIFTVDSSYEASGMYCSFSNDCKKVDINGGKFELKNTSEQSIVALNGIRFNNRTDATCDTDISIKNVTIHGDTKAVIMRGIYVDGLDADIRNIDITLKTTVKASNMELYGIYACNQYTSATPTLSVANCNINITDGKEGYVLSGVENAGIFVKDDHSDLHLVNNTINVKSLCNTSVKGIAAYVPTGANNEISGNQLICESAKGNVYAMSIQNETQNAHYTINSNDIKCNGRIAYGIKSTLYSAEMSKNSIILSGDLYGGNGVLVSGKDEIEFVDSVLEMTSNKECSECYGLSFNGNASSAENAKNAIVRGCNIKMTNISNKSAAINFENKNGKLIDTDVNVKLVADAEDVFGLTDNYNCEIQNSKIVMTGGMDTSACYMYAFEGKLSIENSTLSSIGSPLVVRGKSVGLSINQIRLKAGTVLTTTSKKSDILLIDTSYADQALELENVMPSDCIALDQNDQKIEIESRPYSDLRVNEIKSGNTKSLKIVAEVPVSGTIEVPTVMWASEKITAHPVWDDELFDVDWVYEIKWYVDGVLVSGVASDLVPESVGEVAYITGKQLKDSGVGYGPHSLRWEARVEMHPDGKGVFYYKPVSAETTFMFNPSVTLEGEGFYGVSGYFMDEMTMTQITYPVLYGTPLNIKGQIQADGYTLCGWYNTSNSKPAASIVVNDMDLKPYFVPNGLHIRNYESVNGRQNEVYGSLYDEIFDPAYDSAMVPICFDGKSKFAQLNDEYYTGSNIKLDLPIYYGYKRLSDEDFSVSYKDNKKVGTATVTIKGKGKYKGTLKAKFNIVKADVVCQTEEQNIKAYTGKTINFDTVLVNKFNNTDILKKGTDYTLTYAYKATDDASVMYRPVDEIKKKGYYKVTYKLSGSYGKGTGDVYLRVTDLVKKLTPSMVTVSDVDWTGSYQIPVKVMDGDQELHYEKNGQKGYDFKLSHKYDKEYASFDDNWYPTENNSYQVKVEGVIREVDGELTGYEGTVIKKYKIVGTNDISNYTPVFKNDIEHLTAENGMWASALFEVSELKDKDGNTVPLESENLEYRFKVGKWTVSDCMLGSGIVTVYITGNHNLSGTIKRTVTVGKFDLEKAYKMAGAKEDPGKLMVVFENDKDTISVDYHKGNNAPKVKMSLGRGDYYEYLHNHGIEDSIDTYLSSTADVKLSYENNKKPGTGYVVITGRNNYKGKLKIPYTINRTEFSENASFKMVASDRKPSTKAGDYKTTVKLYDGNVLLKAGTDYDKKLIYKDAKGRVLNAKSKINAGDVITVSAKGKGYYAGWLTTSYTVSKLLVNNAKLSVKNPTYMDNKHVYELSESDISLSYKGYGKLEYGKDYYFGTYENNTAYAPKKGASVYIYGKGNFAGRIKVTYDIKPTPFVWWSKFIKFI